MSDILIPQVLTDILNEELAKDLLCQSAKIFNIPDVKSNASWNGDEPTAVKPGKPLKFNEPPKLKWEPKALAKVKKITETSNGLYISANTFEGTPDYWLNELKKELDKTEKLFTYKQIETRHSDDIVDTLTYAIHPLVGDFKWSGCDPVFAEKIIVPDQKDSLFEKSILEILIPVRYENQVFDACWDVFEHLRQTFAFVSAQEREIAKYSVKDKSELMTPYDIWEKNKIEKGEFPMKTYDVDYNEKISAAKKAYDEARVAAEKEKAEAAQKEMNEYAAKSLKGMYDAYLNAGFTPEQAEKFVTIALEKVASRI